MVKRLMHELAELKRSPVLQASAAPVKDDLMRWKVLVVGGTPYDFPLRIELVYDAAYPMVAPKAYFETPVSYTGGAVISRDGRWEVCLNIFGNFAHVHTEWASQQEGWSPAYTIETILVSLQALLSSDFMSMRPGDVTASRAAALAYRCPETGHYGGDSQTYWPPLPTARGESGGTGGAAASPPEAAAPAVQTGAGDGIMCYVTKAGDDVMGFGIHVERARQLTLSTPCEPLSREAFASGVRASATNKPFEFWVPFVTPRHLWPELRSVWAAAIGAIRQTHPLGHDIPTASVQLCCSLMNSLVVEIMNATHQLTANDKFINGYFALLGVLREIRREHCKVVCDFADAAIKAFIDSPAGRSKAVLPNLGEWLLLLLVSSRYKWADVCEVFVAECDARNVFWYVQGTPASPGACRDLLDRSRVRRAQRIFDATPTSRSIVCYQVRFLQLAAGLNTAALKGALIDEPLRADIKGMYAAIAAMTTWSDHFNWLGMRVRSDEQRDAELVSALDASAAAGYHGGARGGSARGGLGAGAGPRGGRR